MALSNRGGTSLLRLKTWSMSRATIPIRHGWKRRYPFSSIASDAVNFPQNHPRTVYGTPHNNLSSSQNNVLVIRHIKNICGEAMRVALENRSLASHHDPVVKTAAANSEADYQLNSALQLAGQLRVNPKALAEDFSDAISTIPNSGIRRTEVSGPGFVNIHLDDEWLLEKVSHVATKGVVPGSILEEQGESKQKILIDFASPNFGKQLHVGHLRSSVIGDSLCRLYGFIGHDVDPVSHVGDWGHAMSLLLAQIESTVENDKGTIDKAEEIYTAERLGSLYEVRDQENKAASKRAKTDYAFVARANEIRSCLQSATADGQRIDDVLSQFTKEADKMLESGGNQRSANSQDLGKILESWNRVCQTSREEFSTLLSRLSVRVKEMGESQYSHMLRNVLGELQRKKLVVESDGALCVFLDEATETKSSHEPPNRTVPTTNKKKKPKKGSQGKVEDKDSPPMIVQTRDGGFVYATTDLAAIRHRVQNNGYDRVIYVTDRGQSLHFEQLFKVAEMAGWVDREKVKLDHVTFGLVQGADGKKISSRKGAPLTLKALLDEGVEEAMKVALQTEERPDERTEREREAIAEKIGTSAVRYYELSHQRDRNYMLAVGDVLSLRGNTSVYLSYATTRLQALLRKAKSKGVLDPSVTWPDLILSTRDSSSPPHWNKYERTLALTLAQFPDSIVVSAHLLAPHILCENLYRLATAFHSFYENSPILGHQRQDQRLFLCASADSVLRCGLELVGVPPLDRM